MTELYYEIGRFTHSLVSLCISFSIGISFSFGISFIFSYLICNFLNKLRTRKTNNKLQEKELTQINFHDSIERIQKFTILFCVVLVCVLIGMAIHYYLSLSVYHFRKVITQIPLVIVVFQLINYFLKTLIKYKNSVIEKYKERKIIVSTTIILFFPTVLFVLSYHKYYSAYNIVYEICKILFLLKN